MVNRETSHTSMDIVDTYSTTIGVDIITVIIAIQNTPTVSWRVQNAHKILFPFQKFNTHRDVHFSAHIPLIQLAWETLVTLMTSLLKTVVVLSRSCTLAVPKLKELQPSVILQQCGVPHSVVTACEFLAHGLALVDQSPMLLWYQTFGFIAVTLCENLCLQNICGWHWNLPCKDNRSSLKCGERNVHPHMDRIWLLAWCDQGHWGFTCLGRLKRT
jgi:hypothetical protein